MSAQYILYGGKLSYYTGKARAYLRWKGIPFEERQATNEVYQTIIIPRIGYPMIPLLITPEDKAIQDTTEIIDYFEQNDTGPSILPPGPAQRFAAHLLELYGDEWLLIPALHYRWAYNEAFALGEFGELVLPNASEDAQLAAAEKASAMFRGAMPLLGITPEMIPAIERSYLALLSELNTHFSAHQYLLGDRPSIGDFGLIGPLYAHLYRDPASGDIMKKHAPAVAAWVERMHEPPAPQTGEFLPDDEIPETLLPVLNRMMAEQGPCLIDMPEKLSSWKDENPELEIPRAIGMHPFSIEGTPGQRVIVPYAQWMLQRAIDYASSVQGEDRKSIETLAEKIGATDVLNVKIDAPVMRKNYKLFWA